MAIDSPTAKKLSDCVLPGVRLVRARPRVPASAFSRELFPTLERPAIAISRRSHFGQLWSPLAEATNSVASRPISDSGVQVVNPILGGATETTPGDSSRASCTFNVL